MEERINIAELLKDCPKGMKLDCVMFDNVSFAGLKNNSSSIVIHTPDGYKYLNAFGCYHDSCHAKCVIFPKGKNTWERFVSPCKFKDGDILATDLGSVFILNTHRNTNECYGCYTGVCCDGVFYINEPFAYKECCNFATEEEKEELFQTIEENGYKWNEETKSLEKINDLKFKIGDRITNGIVAGKIRSRDNDSYQLDNDVFVFFSALEEWKLVTNKFNINTLKPFDQVLVRLSNNCVWIPKFFSYYDADLKTYSHPFITTDNNEYPQCIPYNGNEHLCRKTNNCDEFYRVWEK